ncbi:hypothetical protein [Arenimonas caeni]|uniref:Pyocin activator protein PrtN n=1 Tax=Arenimonas caeni TaxID=2058085 RepID=A0A2P6M5J2_9GAMM|nr:hypothetical protein [Arenimonas caeni]PRH81268.1 hypothetical protein C6N40_13535 [Arenimonas caeni]
MSTPPDPTLAAALERELFARFGPLLGGDDLWGALGYPSMEAFRQALARNQLPVPVFPLPHRRGKFALVKDVAQWLAACRATATRPTPYSCLP